MMDATLEMLEELLTTIPPIADADAFGQWESAVGQLIASLATREARWAATCDAAEALVRAMPGLPLSLAYGRILGATLAETGVRHE